MDLQPVVATAAPVVAEAGAGRDSLAELSAALQNLFQNASTVLIVIAVILFALHLLFAVLFGRIAAQKGYPGFGWGLFTFLFPVAGVIAIAVKPDREALRREDEYHKNMLKEMHRLNQTMYSMMTGYSDPNQQ